MQTKTMVILAAGMGSRYGGMKQLHAFGPSGETILDYSIYDALKAGFNKLVFIIRKQIESEICNHFLPIWGDRIHIQFAYQELDLYTEDIHYHPERTKPWGTAHALLCVKECVQEPFIIINADDFYSRNAFELASKSIDNNYTKKNYYGLIAYELANTLSDHGTVNRGVCKVKSGRLLSIEECIGISTKEDGTIAYEKENKWVTLEASCKVSMNFWYFSPDIFLQAQTYFNNFLQTFGNELKSEFFIPLLIQKLMTDYHYHVEVIQTPAKWFGITYQQDNKYVEKALHQLIHEGKYPRKI